MRIEFRRSLSLAAVPVALAACLAGAVAGCDAPSKENAVVKDDGRGAVTSKNQEEFMKNKAANPAPETPKKVQTK